MENTKQWSPRFPLSDSEKKRESRAVLVSKHVRGAVKDLLGERGWYQNEKLSKLHSLFLKMNNF